MNIEKLQACADVLGEISTNFFALPTENTKAKEAGLCCLLVQSYVVELAKHLIDGMESYDAMVAAATGEQETPKGNATVSKILTAKPTQ